MGRTRASRGRPRGGAARVLGCILLTAAAPPAIAGVQIVSEGVTVDPTAGSARFWMVLDGPPDFEAVDEFGRPVNSFQYEVDGDWAGGLVSFPFNDTDAVVRGDELDAGGDWSLPIRAAGPEAGIDPDPDAGGWGPVLESVSLNLDGSEMWFDAPLDALGDDDGVFAYRVFTTEQGGTTSFVESSSVPPSNPIPLPPGAWPALVTLLVLAAPRCALRRAP